MENNLLRLIPESRLSAVQTALMHTFQSAAVDDISLLSGGLSGSAVYKMTLRNLTYVLRLGAPSEQGAEALLQASEAGIAPRVHYQESSSGITITDFIESRPIRTAFTPLGLVTGLAKTIRSIHALPCQSPGRDLRQTIEGMVNDFLQKKLLTGPVVEECFSYYAAAQRDYPWQDTAKVLCHNDINPGNLLCDGTRLWMIDWEAAFLNDPYVDLAAAANFFIQTAEQEQEFLQVYFNGAVDIDKKARFYIMRQISRIIYSILLVQAAARNLPAGHQPDQEMAGNTLKAFGERMATGELSLASYEGLLMYGKAQMNEAVFQMRSPRFAAALERFS